MVKNGGEYMDKGDLHTPLVDVSQQNSPTRSSMPEMLSFDSSYDRYFSLQVQHKSSVFFAKLGYFDSFKKCGYLI